MLIQGALTLFLIPSGLVALAVAITQPRADSQESRPSATMVLHRRLRGVSIPVLSALLNGMESVVYQRHDHEVVAFVFEKKRLKFVLWSYGQGFVAQWY